MIFNKQVSKDEFSQFKAKLFRDPVFLEQQKHQYELLKKQCIEKSAHTIQIDTCSGDYLLSSQDCFDCFDVEASKNCKRCRDVYGLEDSYDNYCAGGDHATTYQTYETEN